MKCPTCHELLGNRQLILENKLNEIINKNEENQDEEKTKLINSFGLKYCCNSRLMTYKRLVEYIK